MTKSRAADGTRRVRTPKTKPPSVEQAAKAPAAPATASSKPAWQPSNSSSAAVATRGGMVAADAGPVEDSTALFSSMPLSKANEILNDPKAKPVDKAAAQEVVARESWVEHLTPGVDTVTAAEMGRQLDRRDPHAFHRAVGALKTAFPYCTVASGPKGELSVSAKGNTHLMVSFNERRNGVDLVEMTLTGKQTAFVALSNLSPDGTNLGQALRDAYLKATFS